MIYSFLYIINYLQILCICCELNVMPLVNFWIEENIEKGTFIGRLSSSSSSSSISPTDSLIVDKSVVSTGLSLVDSKFTSVYTCLYTSLAQQPISNYFHIDSNDGSIYALRKIDREALCDEYNLLERVRKHTNDMIINDQQSLSNNTNNNDSFNMKQLRNETIKVTTSTKTDSSRYYRGINHELNILNQPVTTSVCQIKFQVLISDTTGLKSKSSMLQDVQITISDLNDNQPKFDVKNFSLKIPETSPIDAEFRLPQAIDQDTGVNGISEYQLVPCIHKEDNENFKLYASNCHKPKTNLKQKYSNINVFINQYDRKFSTEYNEETLQNNYAGDYFILKIYPRSNGKLQPVLKQIRLLDREQFEWLYLCLIAVDGGGQQGYTCGYIEIIDVNDNVPQWIGLPYRVSVSECDQDSQKTYMDSNNNNYNMLRPQIPTLRYLYTLKAMDVDSGIYGQITYRLAQDSAFETPKSQYQPRVIIRENNLYLLSKLDYEQLTRFVVYVEAVDGGGLMNFTEVEVTVEDCNDHAPTIMVIPVKSSLLNITNNSYSSSMSNKNKLSSSPSSMSGLPITSNIDLLWIEEENYDQIKLATVMSFDRDKKDNGRVTCYLDKSGQFVNTVDYIQLFELIPNQPSSTTTNNDLSSIRQDDTYPNITDKPSMFSLYKKSGVKIDREETQKLLLDIVCTDNGEVNPQITRRTLHIHIKDVNDHAPRFLTTTTTAKTHDPIEHSSNSVINKQLTEDSPFVSQIFSVTENEAFGTYVGTILAKDIDEGVNSQLLYSFASQVDANVTNKINSQNLFEIDKVTGRITTCIPLDRETQSSYLLDVQVQDSGNPSLSSTTRIQINIADVNDMPPVFETADPSGRIIFQLTESIGNRRVHGRLVGRLKAYDNDLGSNQTIRYALVNGSLSPTDLPVTYRVSLDGHIFADGIMDREAFHEHQFTVIAYDSGPINQQLTSSALILIKLLDINDNPPQFIYPSTSTSNKIPTDLINMTIDTAPGTVLYSVQVTDLDEPQHTNFNFTLHSARFLFNYFLLKPNEVHYSETNSYSEASANLILVNSLTQLLPTYKSKYTPINEVNTNIKPNNHQSISSLTTNDHYHYPIEYFLYIIVKDSDQETGFTSTARLRIHVYADSTLTLTSSSIITQNHKVNISSQHSDSIMLTNSEMYKINTDNLHNDDVFKPYGAELKDHAQLYQNKLTTHNSNSNMTILLIISIIIICLFIGVFCSIVIFYIRGNTTNCQDVNRPRLSELYTTTQTTCPDNWSVGELSEQCKIPSTWETLSCKDMAVNLINSDENVLNNTNQTYILNPSKNFSNTERINTMP
ncbi:Protocadherin beta-1 [Schistosoma japonicum]|uniref:Protocadherin beta-1 n=1 Tax=Schistosoma japonicum TaxID=6182 RepID=A0A4Z2DWT2_SCHJA|nr:Protocadherin beta-1 [Schistosoma japonicum]